MKNINIIKANHSWTIKDDTLTFKGNYNYDGEKQFDEMKKIIFDILGK